MAPDKFEQHIKEALNQRALQPSPDAWNTLSKRLDDQTVKKSKSYWWLGVAASIVGILMVAVFANKDASLVTPVIVNNPQPVENIILKNVETTDMPKSKESIIKEKNTSVEEIIVVKNTPSHTIELKKETVKSAEVAAKELTFEQQKIQDVVAQIQLLKDNDSDVSDSEIDALLLEAQREINLNQLYNNKGVVDATLLLQDVEADIDQSFRGKVFEALKDGFGTVKSAVANRNN